MLFTGKFELSIDAKQRIAIPAKVRALMERDRSGAALYIIPGANGVLWLWPEQTFERIAGEVPPSLTPAAEWMDYDIATFPEAERLELDSAGRIRLPQELLLAAGLGQRVLLAGVRHHLELWDPAAWVPHSRELGAQRPELARRVRQSRTTEHPER